MNAQEINNMEIEPTIGEMVANDYRKVAMYISKAFECNFKARILLAPNIFPDKAKTPHILR